MLLRNDVDNFHNFFHQLLVLWIIHVVLSLMSQLVHIFLSTMLSFVSTSSLTVFVFPQVLRSKSDVAGVSLLVPQPPHSRIIGSKIAHRPSNTYIIALTQYPASIDQPSTCFQIRMIDQPPTHFNRRLISRFHQLIRLVFQVRSSRE